MLLYAPIWPKSCRVKKKKKLNGKFRVHHDHEDGVASLTAANFPCLWNLKGRKFGLGMPDWAWASGRADGRAQRVLEDFGWEAASEVIISRMFPWRRKSPTIAVGRWQAAARAIDSDIFSWFSSRTDTKVSAGTFKNGMDGLHRWDNDPRWESPFSVWQGAFLARVGYTCYKCLKSSPSLYCVGLGSYSGVQQFLT